MSIIDTFRKSGNLATIGVNIVTRREEAEQLYRRSHEFLETAIYQVERGFYALAVFNAEQSLQLHLKAKLIEEGVVYPRTHGVRSLMELLTAVTDGGARDRVNRIMDEYLIELGALEDAYITSRYLMREYKLEEAVRLLDVVKEIRGNVR